MSKPKVLCILPIPPPLSGPEFVSMLLLDSVLANFCDLIHLKSNVKSNNTERGKIDIKSIFKLMKLCCAQVILTLQKKPQITYTLLSQNRPGFSRDACFIILAKLLRQKVVVHFHGGGFDVFYGRSNRVWKFFISQVMKRVDRLIVQAERLRPLFESLVSPEKIEVVYNGVNVSLFSEVTKRTEENVGKRDEASGPNVLFVGHLSVAKGFKDLLETAPEVLAQCPNVKFIIVGEWLKEERNIMVDAHGRSLQVSGVDEAWRRVEEDEKLCKHFHMVGTVEGTRKLEIFSQADIFVLPSYSEGFPLSILEAMAAGLPVISTPVGAIPEIIEDEVNGLLIHPGRSDELAKAIVRLAENKKLRECMGAANMEQARTRFDIDSIVSSMYGVFQRSLP